MKKYFPFTYHPSCLCPGLMVHKGGGGCFGYLYSSERPNPHIGIYEFQLWFSPVFTILCSSPPYLRRTQAPGGTRLNLGYWSRFCAVIGFHPSIEPWLTDITYWKGIFHLSKLLVVTNYTSMYKFSLRQRRVGLGAIAGQRKILKIGMGSM